MLPKKRLAKAEQEGEDTIIRGAHAKQSFQNVLGLHFESGNAIQGKLGDGDADEESEEDESRMTANRQ